MAENITFVLQPETDFASLGMVAKSIEDICRLIRFVDYSATRRKDGRLWQVRKIQSTAPTLTLVPPPGEADAVDIIADGLHLVTEVGTSAPPDYFSEDALQHLSRMRRLFRGRERLSRVLVSVGDELSLEKPVATIRSDITTKVEPILRGGYSVSGFLEGTLEAINLHGGAPTFTIWEQISGVPVRCAFPNSPDWKGRVRELLEKPVLVEGQVNYFRNGVPRSVTRIENVLDITPDPYLPQATYGAIPDMTGDMDTIEYLRATRGG
jgi:hypothetical protein